MAKWLIDGVSLDDPQGRWAVSAQTLPPTSASQRTSILELQRRSGGVARRLGWGFSAARIVVNVFGADDAETERRARALRALMARTQTLTFESGVARAGQVVQVRVSEPVREAPTMQRVVCEFQLQPFWSEAATLTSASKPIPGAVTLSEWAGTTGDIMDGILRVRGPLTRCSIMAVDGTGVSFEYALTSSQYAYVDPVNVRAWRGGSSQWTPSANLIPLDYPAAGTLVLTPGGNGVALTVAAEGTDDQTSGLVLRGRKWWL